MTTNTERAADRVAEMVAHDVDVLAADPADENGQAYGPAKIARAAITAATAELPAVHLDADNRPQVFVTAIRPGQVGNVRVDKDGAFRTIGAWGDPQNAAEARERAYAYLALADALESGDYSPGQTTQGVDQ